MALAKFRKIISGGKKTATPDLSTPKKDKPKEDKKQLLAGLAQLVEHFTCNEDVAGSNPASGSVWQPG